MSAFKINKINDGSNDIKDLRIHIQFDGDNDLKRFESHKNLSFIERISQSPPKILPKTLALFSHLFPKDTNFESTHISIDGPVVLYGKDLDELIHKIELALSNELIDWNKKYINNINPLNHKEIVLNDNEKNEYLNNLYKKEFTSENHWYNIHNKIYNKSKLNNIIRLKEHLEKKDFSLLDLTETPSVNELSTPKLNWFEKLIGNEYKLIEHQKKVENINQMSKIVSLRNDERLSVNKKNNDFINEAKETVSSLINHFTDELENKFINTINNYEDETDIVPFISSILKFSVLNSIFNFSYQVNIIDKEKHIICNVFLPNDLSISKIKTFKEYKRDNRKEPIYYKEKEFAKVYDSIIYSILFRLIIEIYLTDYDCKVTNLTINGWVNSINKKNGKKENKCILSVSINREQFNDIDFENVDLKTAFKNLKGISAASFFDFIPVAPIINIDKNDKRFVQSEEVLKNITDYTNIAAIDWEEFEHLVRELFEKEFAVNGGEVKVTQSSRDGGVDAIAFDPDPIRGGKIIIQSKRYTNVVGVSAIRDLYGTVLNEGASKGIIVTTSHYGNDAYEFAKGKPLTLLEGNHLLHLLEKHGYKAKIDIQEAKKILNNNL